MSSSLTLRQRQHHQQRKMMDDETHDSSTATSPTGCNNSTPRTSPKGLSVVAPSASSSAPNSPMTPSPQYASPSSSSVLGHKTFASRRNSARKAHIKCSRSPLHAVLRSSSLWVLFVVITTCLLLYNLLPPPTLRRFLNRTTTGLGSSSSPSSMLLLRHRSNNHRRNDDNSYQLVFPSPMDSSSRGLCVPATAYLPQQEFLARHHRMVPNFGGIYMSVMSSLSSTQQNWHRNIHTGSDARLYEHERNKLLDKMDVHPDGLGRRYEDDYEYSQNHECRRNNWRSRKYPSCNRIHEVVTLDRTTNSYNDHGKVEYKGHGAFRDSWLFSSSSHNNNDDTDFVLKSLRLRSSLDYTYDIMYQIHKEAIVMERLSASPRIVDIFGYCGTTILAEHMSRLITGDIVWGSEDWEGYDGWMSQSELDKLQVNDVHPMNNLTNDEKLDMAIVMAESIADIHGFEGGVIVHGDIHPIQWLQNPKGQIKLNDFNNGEMLDFYPEDNEYCKIYRCYGGTYRSPEEFRCMDSNEAMDTYSMGNNIYILLVGLWPFYQYNPDDSRAIQKKLIDNTERPYVDPRYRNRSDIEAGLVHIMEQCWEWDMEKRIPIFDVVKQLYELRDQVRGKKSK